MRCLIGLICLFLSAWINTKVQWNLKEWTTSPLPRPESALLLSAEFPPLSSDYFLMKAAIFYSGMAKFKKTESLWLSKALYLASYLDPYYFEPYWMAGVSLPWEGRLQEAKKILKRGLNYLNNRWEIPFYLGFISFYFEHDNKVAANYFLMASKLPNAPTYLPLLASRLAVKGRETRIAIAFLQEQLKMTKEKKIRSRLKKRLKALQAISFLERAVERYKEIYGHLPLELNSLIKQNIISTIPEDPYGGSFYLTEDGRIWSTSNLR